MDQIIRAATPEQIAAAEARTKAAEERASKPAPQFVGGKAREQVVPLVWPLEYDGVTYDSLTVKRLRGSDFDTLSEQRTSTAIAAFMTGAPEAVIEALDGEDFVELQAVIQSFIPPRMKAAAEQILATGQNTQR